MVWSILQQGKPILKTCKTCGSVKPLSEYHRAAGYAGGYKPQCITCYRGYQKEQRAKITPAIRRDYWVKHKYGISLEQQESRLLAQGGVCAICKKPMARLCVDHCHTTGYFRGLLCTPCNTGLGAFKDDVSNLIRAVDYLKGRHL